MKEQIETAEPRIKFMADDSYEARKTATGHSCGTLANMLKSTMVLENCPTTMHENEYWEKEIKNKFPILNGDGKRYILSIKDYITQRPQKLYNEQVYHQYLKFLNSYITDKSKFIVAYKEIEHDLNIAIKTLYEINNQDYHEKLVPTDSIQVINFIEKNIHYNYLSLTESVFHKFIKLIAIQERQNRKKPISGLDIFNCVEELAKTDFNFITSGYDNTMRNGIAHGWIVYKERDIQYKGKRGKPVELGTSIVIRMFDDMLDVCNGLCLALKVFYILNKENLTSFNLSIPKQLLIQELKAQTNAPRWQVLDCLESEIMGNRKQLNVFTKNSLRALEEVNYYAFRTAVFAEYFAPGYDRYFFSLDSKFSLNGFGGYDGKILRTQRLKGDDDLTGYTGVLEGSLLYFKPRFELPKLLRKVNTLASIFKSMYKITFHEHTNNYFKKMYEVRDIKAHTRKLKVIINDPSIHLLFSEPEEIIEFVRTKHKRLINHTIRKSKATLKNPFTSFMRTEYIRITLYDSDLRKRHFRDSGLIDSLICSIEVNKSKKINTIDFIGGIPEQYGKYRIIWNKNWKQIKHVC